MEASTYILLYTFQNTDFHLHYFTLLLTTALRGGQEFVAYPHFTVEETEDKSGYMTYLTS